MKLSLGALAVLSLAQLGNAQEVVNGARTILGRLTSTGPYSAVDFTGAGSTAPVKTGTLAARPVACTSGQMYFATDAAAGQNLSYCVPPGGWRSGSAAGAVCQLASALGFALDGSDETTTMNAVFANFYAAGGGCLAIDQNKTLRIDGQIILPHGGSPKYYSPPYRITGAGRNWGGGEPYDGISTLDLRYAGSANGNFKFQHVGHGQFELDHLTVKDGGADCNPYFVLNGDNEVHQVTFVPSTTGTGCNTFLTTGGTAQPNAAFTGTYSDWFWGQSLIHHNLFNPGRALLAKSSSNAMVFDSNVAQGPAAGGVALIDFQGYGTGGFASRGSVISNNLIEVVGGATCGINLHNTENAVIEGNGFWDGAGGTYGICGDSTATKNTIAKTNFVDLTGGTLVNPSFGVNSNNYWPWRTVPFFFDGGGSALSGSITRCGLVSFGGKINQFSMAADQSGSATVTVKAIAFGSYTGPGSASDISNGGESLSSAVTKQDATLTGWTTTVTPNTMLCFTLSSPSTVTWVGGNVQIWEGR